MHLTRPVPISSSDDGISLQEIMALALGCEFKFKVVGSNPTSECL